MRDESDSYRVSFAEIAENVNVRADDPANAGVEIYVGLEHLDADSMRLTAWGHPSDVESTKLRFWPGDVILGRRRVYQRKMAVADREGICSAHALVLRPRSEAIDPTFFPFFIQSNEFMSRAEEISVGSLSPTVNWSDLAECEFELPPRPAQKRLSAVLQSIESAMVGLDAVVESARTAAKSLVSSWAETSNDPWAATSELLSERPKNGLSPPEATGGSVDSVSISAVRDGVLEPDGNRKPVNVDPDRAHDFLVRSGDAFVIRGNGNRHLVGKIGIAASSHDDLIYPDLLIRLRFDPMKVDPLFAVALWNTPPVHRLLIARAKSSNGIWKVNGQDVVRHQLPIPKRQHQTDLVETWSGPIQAAVAAEERRVALRSLKTRVLTSAFEGAP